MDDDPCHQERVRDHPQSTTDESPALQSFESCTTVHSTTNNANRDTAEPPSLSTEAGTENMKREEFTKCCVELLQQIVEKNGVDLQLYKLMKNQLQGTSPTNETSPVHVPYEISTEKQGCSVSSITATPPTVR